MSETEGNFKLFDATYKAVQHSIFLRYLKIIPLHISVLNLCLKMVNLAIWRLEFKQTLLFFFQNTVK